MKFTDYQEKIRKFDKYPENVKPNIYIIGLVGETLELSEKAMPYLVNRPVDVNSFVSEMGDIFWYITRLADVLNIKLNFNLPHTMIVPKMVLLSIFKMGVHAGRILESYKKTIRDDNSVITESRKNMIQERLEMMLERMNDLANYIGISMEEIMYNNYKKLSERYATNTISGSGESIQERIKQ